MLYYLDSPCRRQIKAKLILLLADILMKLPCSRTPGETEKSPPTPQPRTWARSQSESLKLELSAQYLTPLAVYSSGAPFVRVAAPTKDQNGFPFFFFFWAMQFYFCLCQLGGRLGGEEGVNEGHIQE